MSTPSHPAPIHLKLTASPSAVFSACTLPDGVDFGRAHENAEDMQRFVDVVNLADHIYSQKHGTPLAHLAMFNIIAKAQNPCHRETVDVQFAREGAPFEQKDIVRYGQWRVFVDDSKGLQFESWNAYLTGGAMLWGGPHDPAQPPVTVLINPPSLNLLSENLKELIGQALLQAMAQWNAQVLDKGAPSAPSMRSAARL